MAFLKLEQNVQAFQNAVEVLADRLSLRGGAREYASALIVGRYPDGRPLSSTPMKESDMDDFNFSDDADGAVCPFHSHIRKMNPRPGANRGGDGLLPIARRSVLYGERPDLTKAGRKKGIAAPTERVGLLFMSLQGDLAQFVWHQRRADDPDFPVRNTGLDPLCGADRSSSYGVPAQTWTGPRTERFRFQDFVRMKGGEYFFAPSIPFLKTLGK
jgi:deferrochelatase/peroxidase EfeB